MRRGRMWVAVGFAALATVHLVGHLDPPMAPIHGDGYYTYLYARSLVFDGDWDLGNDYALCGDPWRMRTRMGEPEPGMRPHNPWNPGPGLLWAPFLAYARATFPEADDPDPLVAQACKGDMAEFAMLGTVLAGLLTLWLGYLFARRHVGRGAAFLGVAAVGLATALPYYATLLPSYNHALAAFGVALVLERWDATRGSRRWHRWVMLGALVGLAMLMRAQNALVVIAPLAEWILLARRDLSFRRWRAFAGLVGLGVLFTVALVAAFSPQLYLWKLTYGTIFAVPQGEHFMRWSTPHVAGVLWASTGGLLVWTPILYAAFFGVLLAAARRDLRFLGVVLVLIVAAYTYVNASAYDYFGSASFSNRRFTALSVPFAFGIAVTAAAVFRWAERRPRAFAGTVMTLGVAAFALWNYAAMWGVASTQIQSHREQPMVVFWRQTFDRMSDGMWKKVGNPLAWPASIPFALAYDTHPRRWDVMRGMVVFYQNEQTRAPRTGNQEHQARFDKPYQFEYAVEGFEEEARVVDGKRSAVTVGKHARILLPLFWDDVDAVEVRWQVVRARDDRRPAEAEVTMTWNGVPVATSNVGDRWHGTVIQVPRGLPVVGINELSFHLKGGPVAFESIEMKQIPREHAPPRVR